MCAKKDKSNDIFARNGRVLKFYLFIVWLLWLKKYIMLRIFFPSDAL